MKSQLSPVTPPHPKLKIVTGESRTTLQGQSCTDRIWNIMSRIYFLIPLVALNKTCIMPENINASQHFSMPAH